MSFGLKTSEKKISFGKCTCLLKNTKSEHLKKILSNQNFLNSRRKDRRQF